MVIICDHDVFQMELYVMHAVILCYKRLHLGWQVPAKNGIASPKKVLVPPPPFEKGESHHRLSPSITNLQASEASGIAQKAQVKLAALKPTAAAPAILEIHGPLDRAAAACYFVQLQLWLDSTLGKSRA